MPEETRIGIIGAGGIAGAHVSRYKKLPNVKIVAVSDVVPGKAEAFIHHHGLENAKAFIDHGDLLQVDMQGVSVCTPNAAHYKPVMDALAAGKHVLVEKPLSVTLKEGVDMVRAAREADRMLSVGFQSRYDTGIRTAKKLIDDGVLGSIYYAESGGGRRKGIPGGTFVSKALAGGGVMLDIGCYSVDTMMYLLGNPRPLTVSAVTSAHFGTSPRYAQRASWGAVDPATFDVEDFSAAFIRLEGDITFIVRISWAMHLDHLGPSVILGTDGGLKMEGRTLRLFHDEGGRNAETTIDLGSWNDDSLWMQKMGEFVAAIRNQGPAPIPAAQILYGQAILEAIYRSAGSRQEVAVEVPEDVAENIAS